MISLAGLIAAGFAPTQARLFVDPLTQVFELRGLDSLQRQAAFVAQAGVESEMFTELEEQLYYKNASRIRLIFPNEVKSDIQAQTLVGNPKGLANTVYAGRNGNGSYLTGDGWNFRGRGFGITGRANYAYCQVQCNEPYITQPDLVSTPGDACLTFGAYWARAGCNELADKSDIDGITRAINGPGMAGAADRRALYSACMKAFR